ncbi:MAG: MFS transporter [Candidatus Eremiobacteraeota bacterium]|nr:MFS transporter [Candidatus Eremiobacteraeota bacterium]
MAVFIKHPCDNIARSAEPSRRTVQAGTWVLIATVLGSAMPLIDGTAVNVVLPILQRDLHADAATVQWIVEGYSLFLSALILIGGGLGDVFGRRRMFVVGIVLFAIASGGCAFARTAAELLVARCAQGIGAALLVPESLALISAQFVPKDRGKAIGTWSAFSAISTAIGPVFGGYIAQHFSWRWVFFINIPIAAFIIYIAVRHISESHDETVAKRVDYVGAALASLGLGGLVYGLISAQGGFSLGALSVGVSALILLVVFVVYEGRSANPMMPLRFFASSAFAGANAYTLLLYAGLGGGMFFIPFDLINVQHYSPTAAGAAMLPMIVILFLFSRYSGAAQAKVGPRILLVAGALVAMLAYGLFALTGQGKSYWVSFFPAAVVLGIAAAIFVAPLTATVMNAIETAHAGIASGINNAVARTAGLIAIAALGLVLSVAFYGTYDREMRAAPLSAHSQAVLQRDRDRIVVGYVPAAIQGAERAQVASIVADAFTRAFEVIMFVCAALAFGAGIIALFAFPGRRDAVAQRAA